MKTVITFALLSFAFIVHATAAQYVCHYEPNLNAEFTYSGTIYVTFEGDETIKVQGDYSKIEEGKVAPQAHVECTGRRTLPETRASYFNKWASFRFLAVQPNVCHESSVRVSKGADGTPSMKSIQLINYNGDNHDSSGYQSFYFKCKPAL